MNLKSILPKLAIFSMLILILGLVVSALPKTGPGAMVDEHWWHIIISDDEAMTAAATHDIDALGVPRPADLDWFLDDPGNDPYGWTITSTQRIGYTFFMENNRVWPFGTPNGRPEDPNYDAAMYLRKGIHRIINKDEIYGIYTPVMSLCPAWLPPVQAYWINPAVELPPFDPTEAAAMFDAGGWVEGTTTNPDYDPGWHPASAQYMRIDPTTGSDMASFEYYAIGPVEAPIGYEMAVMITSWMLKMGLPCNLVAGTWLGMVGRLVNTDLYDYQIMTGVGITWGSLAPDILFDFTYHTNLPLWNFVSMNISALNVQDERMMATLDIDEARAAAFEIQTLLNQYEPYLPLLLWEMMTAYTDAWPEATAPFTNPGFIGIVNAKGFGGLASQNNWGKLMGRADRWEGDAQINKWRLGAYIDTLNPLTADTVPDWQVLTPVMEGHYSLSPYTHDYMWYGATDMPSIEPWIGPGAADVTGPGNGVYDAPVTYVDGELATYDGIAVADVTADDLVGDDSLGMAVTWTLKDGLYWHDSDPGEDLEFGTGDDGTVYPVTAEDYLFGYELMLEQDNMRYYSGYLVFVADVELKSPLSYTVYEERRYLWSFEGHGSPLLVAKHIWEPWIAGTDGILWNEDDNHHELWYGWENQYMECPVHPGQYLTELIGFGPFHYHYGGWTPGQYAHVETNPVYFYSITGSDQIIGDVNLDGTVFIDDLYIIVGSFGLHPNVDLGYDDRGDIAFPAQIIDLDDVYEATGQIGKTWYP